jgi:hypothetical protein
VVLADPEGNGFCILESEDATSLQAVPLIAGTPDQTQLSVQGGKGLPG